MKKNPIAIMMQTDVSITPSNQLVLPSKAIRFIMTAARNRVTNSYIVNSNVND